MLRIVIASLGLLAGSASAAVIDVTRLVGEDRLSVDLELGPAQYCLRSNHGQRCQYGPGATQIMFIGGKAQWITVQELGGVPYGEQALAELGLPVRPPQERTAQYLRWHGLADLREVSMFPADDQVFMIYIEAE